MTPMTANKQRALGPAPEPKQRPDPDAMKRLMAETAELGGFMRPSGPPASEPVEAAETVPAPSERPAGRPTQKRTASTRDDATPKGGVLKCDVGDELFEELRVAAVRRRVTVKYLLVEALATHGYSHADLNAIPKDGRRDR